MFTPLSLNPTKHESKWRSNTPEEPCEASHSRYRQAVQQYHITNSTHIIFQLLKDMAGLDAPRPQLWAAWLRAVHRFEQLHTQGFVLLLWVVVIYQVLLLLSTYEVHNVCVICVMDVLW